MSQLVTSLLYVIGIGGMFLLLIAPHEGGHFLFAKLFHSKPAWQRIVILAGGPAANFLVAMLLITAFGLTQLNTDPGKVFSVAPGSPAAVAGLQVGDSIRAVNGQPFTTPGLVSKQESNAPGAPLTLSGVHANGSP